jgi:hypothetical protein
MALDGSAQTKDDYELENHLFRIDTFTREQIGDHLIIDFNQQYGYILKNNNEILSFGLRIQS